MQFAGRCAQPAQFASFFPSTDAGTSTMAPALVNLPNKVLRAVVGGGNLATSGLNELRAAIAANPNPSADDACLKRCGLA